MAWATSSNVSTTNLDAGTASPAAARADIKVAFDELKIVIDGRNTANGVAPLDAASLIPAANLPNEINSSSGQALTLDPSSGKVNLEEILNLKPQTVAQLNARTDIARGDIAFCTNGSAGTECLAVAVTEDDSAGMDTPIWKIIDIGNAISET